MTIPKKFTGDDGSEWMPNSIYAEISSDSVHIRRIKPTESDLLAEMDRKIQDICHENSITLKFHQDLSRIIVETVKKMKLAE